MPHRGQNEVGYLVDDAEGQPEAEVDEEESEFQVTMMGLGDDLIHDVMMG